ncbi:GyrI-like domain-containing protein [Campylobacter canadensis]|uniref:GyrI-like domain-containing protein n=1 Tax=Campylobacter canadensis TaxID=449520 RepID=A0ABS7WS27_9BACT|nr:GyrI-like domain-containing protein [Campylobacter canadensis]MBZ7987566.1 GyrI-like domain-containing protein [Campylobacter canadensis]MBZ7994911.1 GyrI-like domain-containing protein [Campylobacter canadensis]MBZ7996702.1 GyrI-like domain-containing protein [Campylobacter canadensis]MBZ7998678.1 GyrI-like domain-containing protein [Campylobacter canadensis]MBZ8000328.1 GyrI-like domain-containing protein [Campylobacter canadensis]
MAFDFKKAYKEFYQAKKIQILNIPPINYVAVRGKGDPNEPNGAYQKAISKLYAISYTLKMSYKSDYKIKNFFEYVVPPLEGFWWQDNLSDVDYSKKYEFNFISLIRLPDFISEDDFKWAVKTASQKKKIDCSLVEFLNINEGLCVQTMHIGSYDEEPQTILKMKEFTNINGYEFDVNNVRKHHEIYLSDPRKVAKEKLKTIIRIPIKAK